MSATLTALINETTVSPAEVALEILENRKVTETGATLKVKRVRAARKDKATPTAVGLEILASRAADGTLAEAKVKRVRGTAAVREAGPRGFTFGETWMDSVFAGEGIAIKPQNFPKLLATAAHYNVTVTDDLNAIEIAAMITEAAASATEVTEEVVEVVEAVTTEEVTV